MLWTRSGLGIVLRCGFIVSLWFVTMLEPVEKWTGRLKVSWIFGARRREDILKVALLQWTRTNLFTKHSVFPFGSFKTFDDFGNYLSWRPYGLTRPPGQRTLAG